MLLDIRSGGRSPEDLPVVQVVDHLLVEDDRLLRGRDELREEVVHLRVVGRGDEDHVTGFDPDVVAQFRLFDFLECVQYQVISP